MPRIILAKRNLTAVAALSSILIFFTLFGFYQWSSWSPHRARLMKAIEYAKTIPSPSNAARALVMVKTSKEDVEWARKLAPDWSSYIYSTNEEPGTLHLPLNRGREGMAYLTFIIDNYDGLPESTAFVHAAPQQRHNDVVGDKTAEIIRNLRIDTIQAKGYVNLRCHLDPGCPFAVFPLTPSKSDIENDDTRAHFAMYYRELFNVSKEQIPHEIGSVCCAQFAVSRDRIRQRPKEDYIRMREWAMHANLDSFGIGWVFEKVWHIVFGEGPTYGAAVHLMKPVDVIYMGGVVQSHLEESLGN